MRFSPASRLQGRANLRIKQKAAAQGNIEQTSGRLAAAIDREIAFRNRPWCPASRSSRYIAAASDTTRTSKSRKITSKSMILMPLFDLTFAATRARQPIWELQIGSTGWGR